MSSYLTNALNIAVFLQGLLLLGQLCRIAEASVLGWILYCVRVGQSCSMAYFITAVTLVAPFQAGVTLPLLAPLYLMLRPWLSKKGYNGVDVLRYGIAPLAVVLLVWANFWFSLTLLDDGLKFGYSALILAALLMAQSMLLGVLRNKHHLQLQAS